MVMSKIHISREYVELQLLAYIDELFALPEIAGVKLRDIVIQNDEHKEANLKEAISKSYHDCYSDVDLAVLVTFPTKDTVTKSEYMKRIDRFGIEFHNGTDIQGIYQLKKIQ